MKKKTIDYPLQLLNIVHTMSFNKNNTIIAGSSSYYILMMWIVLKS